MTIDRRTFVAAAGGLAAMAALGRGAIAQAARPHAFGLQLYTVREIFQKDPVGTLEAVARIGYREVEFGGGNYDGMDHRLLRRTLDRLGLKAPSIHVPYDRLKTDFGAVARMAKTLGADTIVFPWLSPEFRTEQGFEPVIPDINRFARQAHEAGFGFAYHNHDFEFANRSHGVSLYERLIRDTDPAHVKLELDLYWVAYAGQDAAKIINRLSSRLYAFHAKDMRQNKQMAAVGTGTIDFPALFRLPAAAGVRHFYVENDDAKAPYLPDITTSFHNLSAMRF